MIRFTSCSILAFIIFIAIGSCKKEPSPEEVQLSCNWPPQNRAGEKIENFQTEVVILRDSFYVFNIPNIGSFQAGTYLPCNLPNEAKKGGVKVKISGYAVTFDGIENVAFLGGAPFELTSIEYLK